MEIVEYIQGKSKHSIDVLLAIHAMSIDGAAVSWKHIKDWFRNHSKNIADGTYRARRRELEEMGLVEKEHIDSLKFSVKLTPLGVEVVHVMEEMIKKLESIENKESCTVRKMLDAEEAHRLEAIEKE